jgi:hypothetical protein
MVRHRHAVAWYGFMLTVLSSMMCTLQAVGGSKQPHAADNLVPQLVLKLHRNSTGRTCLDSRMHHRSLSHNASLCLYASMLTATTAHQ